MVDVGSYVLHNAVSGAVIATNGQITISTTSAIALTPMTVSVTTNNNDETHTSSPFLIVEDCLSVTTIPSISDKKIQKLSSSLTIDAAASSTSSNCVLSNYAVSPTISGVTIDIAG